MFQICFVIISFIKLLLLLLFFLGCKVYLFIGFWCSANEKMKAMEQTLLKGRRIQDECSVDAKKLRGIIHSTEQQLRVQEKQTLFLTHLTAKTVPKGLHCLPLRLSADYYSLKASSQQFPNQDKLQDPNLFHYALFSDNVLATAVVVNSTISSSKVCLSVNC